MASELYVETLKGLTSGANANKIVVPSGQTLYAQGHVLNVYMVRVPHNNTTHDSFSTTSQSPITGFSITVTPSSVDSEFIIESFPHAYLAPSIVNQWTGLNLRVTRSVSGQSDVVLNADGDGQELHFAKYSSVGGNSTLFMGNGTLIVKDTPNTTSSVTYVGTAAKTTSGSNNVAVHAYGSGFFKVTEIAG